MKINKNELRMFYKHEDKVFADLDRAIGNMLEFYGFKPHGSSFNFHTGVREISFKLKEDKDEKFQK